MGDLTPEQRHRAMAANRGRTRPERALASALWHRGLRYLTAEGFRTRHGSHLPGKPDVVFTRMRVALFLDGCFWHGCPKCRGTPNESGEFWRAKIERNMARDKTVTRDLRKQGWRVVRVPEHDVARSTALNRTADRLFRLLTRS